jgi:hypothetical protein
VHWVPTFVGMTAGEGGQVVVGTFKKNLARHPKDQSAFIVLPVEHRLKAHTGATVLDA